MQNLSSMSRVSLLILLLVTQYIFLEYKEKINLIIITGVQLNPCLKKKASFLSTAMSRNF